MVQSVNYYWIQVQVSPSCQSHFTCNASHCTHCQNLLQKHKEYRLEMVNVLVYYSLLGIKNVFALEGGIHSRDCCFKFLNRSVPIYPEEEIILKPNNQKLVKVEAPFIDEISGMAIIKILDGGTYSTLLIKLKFTHNKAILNIVNKGKDTMILIPEEMTGIRDLRSLWYYKIKQGILQQNLNRYYRFEKAEKLCEYFNKFVNTLKREREQKSPTDNYP